MISSWRIDVSGIYTEVRGRKEQYLKQVPGSLLGASLFTCMVESDAALLRKRLERVRSASERLRCTIRYKGSGGSLLVTRMTVIPEWGEDGSITGFSGEEACLAFVSSRAKRFLSFESVLGLVQTPTCFVDRQQRILAVNAEFAGLCKTSPEDLVGQDIHTCDLKILSYFDEDCEKLLAGEPVPERNFSMGGRDFFSRMFAMPDAKSGVKAACLVFRDVTVLKDLERRLEEANRRLSQMNERDYLTGCYNRLHFDRTLARMQRIILAQKKDERIHFSLIMLDVDLFKRFNDTYGHVEGDHCLISVAKALEGIAEKAGGALFRYGGEEFTVLLPNCRVDTAAGIAEEMRRAVFSLGIPHGGHKKGFVTISLGVAGTEGMTAALLSKRRKCLLEEADSALYAAKHAGRDCVRRAESGHVKP
ncbi:MAG: diguanylate cyclase [Desulfovibrio sp.]|nr:diguanylate cyclase [Desulfovibrio sp.]